MNSDSAFLEFTPDAEHVGTTLAIIISSKRTKEPLGHIRWLTKWRQYVVYPMPGTAFNHRCLSDITAYLVGMMDEWALEHGKEPRHGEAKFNEGLKAARLVNQKKRGETKYTLDT